MADVETDDAQRLRPGLRVAMLHKVFGYDYFISYAHSDGQEYAKALAHRLRSDGYECFFDLDRFRPGDHWKHVGIWTLRRTTCLLLILSRNAFRSEPVLYEVSQFSSFGKRIVPIDFGFFNEHTSAPIRQYVSEEVLRLDESTERLKLGPSEDVIAGLRKEFRETRQDRWRLRILSTAVILFAVVAAATVTFRFQAHYSKVSTLVDGVTLSSTKGIEPPEFQRIVESLRPFRDSVIARLTANVHQTATQSDPVLIGKQRADTAITLLFLDEFELAMEYLRCSPNDVETITQFAARCRIRAGLDQERLVECLKRAADRRRKSKSDSREELTLTCYGLLLALGEFTDSDSQIQVPRDIVPMVRNWYETDSSSAIHGACGWLLRQSGEDMDAIHRRLAVSSVADLSQWTKDWFVLDLADVIDGMSQSHYLTFVIFRSSETNGRDDLGLDHNGFAICDREITNSVWSYVGSITKGLVPQSESTSRKPAQFRGFPDRLSEANNLCGQLSKGLPKPFRFRLPTKNEWELACRGGTTTQFSFGSDPNMLARYGAGSAADSHQENADAITEPLDVGSLRPNTKGLFDMHGNGAEICIDSPFLHGGGVGMDLEYFESSAEGPDVETRGGRLCLAIAPAGEA